MKKSIDLRYRREAVENLFVCFGYLAQIFTEAVAVETFERLRVPQACGIGRYLVGNDKSAVGSASEFELSIDQSNAYLCENAL